jgi:hypothetical protein
VRSIGSAQPIIISLRKRKAKSQIGPDPPSAQWISPEISRSGQGINRFFTVNLKS